METQQAETRAPGETFRRGVSRALEALEKVTFLPQDVKENITSSAARLCLAEAIAEQKAVELGKKAKAEWDKEAPQLKASVERLLTELPGQVQTELERLKAAIADLTNKTPNASADKAADSPQTPPPAEGKPEA